MGKDNQNKPDQTISIANHLNSRENYMGWAVPDLPVTRNRIFSECFGIPSKQKNEEPMLRLAKRYSSTLYKNINSKSGN